MTHPFPLFAVQSAETVHVRYPTLSLDWPARLGFILTFLKVPLTAVIVLFLYQHNLVAVNAMVVLSIIIDIGDGIIFNKSRFAENRYLRESRRIWDGTLDRFIIWTTLLFALITIHFPLTLFTIIMVREFAVCLTTGLPYIRHAFVHSPNLPSKLGAVLIAAQLISFNQAAMIPLWLTFTFLALSGVGLVLYVVRPRQI